MPDPKDWVLVPTAATHGHVASAAALAMRESNRHALASIWRRSQRSRRLVSSLVGGSCCLSRPLRPASLGGARERRNGPEATPWNDDSDVLTV
jgi:hypothetical protein